MLAIYMGTLLDIKIRLLFVYRRQRDQRSNTHSWPLQSHPSISSFVSLLLTCHPLRRFRGDPLASQVVVPRSRGEPFVPLIFLQEVLKILSRMTLGRVTAFAFLCSRSVGISPCLQRLRNILPSSPPPPSPSPGSYPFHPEQPLHQHLH